MNCSLRIVQCARTKRKTIAAQMAISGRRGGNPAPPPSLLSFACLMHISPGIFKYNIPTAIANRNFQFLHTQTCVCACVYVLYICSCCCCQLLPLLPEFLKRFAYFINRKCSLRATDKNNCYCHCRFSLSLLQVPPFPSAASDCSFNFSSDSNRSNSSSSSSPGPSWSLIPGGRRCSFYCSIAKYS